MKLKPILVNGYTVLVDESAEIKEGDYYHNNTGNAIERLKHRLPSSGAFCNKIIFAEKELNLDVPILPNWREWEVEQLAKYTEEDLKKCYNKGFSEGVVTGTCNMSFKHMSFDEYFKSNEFIQSLQKYPKYIVMESENNQKTINYHKDLWADDWQPKLTTNAQGKKVGIIKEIIY